MPSLKLRRAYHESGHVAAALRLGIAVRDVTIIGDFPQMRRDERRFRPADTLARAQRLTLICLSGPAAELHFCGPFEDDGDLGDVMQARRYLGRWFEPPAVEQEIAHWRDEARRLVRQRWAGQRIKALAGHLLACGSLSGREIGRLVAP